MSSNKIFVGNLSYSASEDDLEEAFKTFGEITGVKIVRERASGRSRGFGFVTYVDPKAAKDALSMNDKELNGRKLRVNEAREKEHSRE
jgi:heterogeneous nuclear ribonucleoprotein A1/A3